MEENKMELKFLGRGSAFNVEEGNTAAYFKIDKNLILIDCGELIFERLITKKILDDVDDIYVFITHLHSDHVGSLLSLINYAYYILKTKINIIYPDYSNNNICSSLGSNMVTNNKYDIISVVQFNHI